MAKILIFFSYSLAGIIEFLELDRFRVYRAYKGGIWYKHQLNGELPNCYGTFWANYGKINRYTDIIKTEDYTDKKTKQITKNGN